MEMANKNDSAMDIEISDMNEDQEFNQKNRGAVVSIRGSVIDAQFHNHLPGRCQAGCIALAPEKSQKSSIKV